MVLEEFLHTVLLYQANYKCFSFTLQYSILIEKNNEVTSLCGWL